MKSVPVKLRTEEGNLDSGTMNVILKKMQSFFVSEVLEEKKLSDEEMEEVIAAAERELGNPSSQKSCTNGGKQWAKKK